MPETTKMIRHIQPLGLRVLVRVLKEPDVAESGLYLPAGAKEKMQESLYGEVIEVARAEAKNLNAALAAWLAAP